MATDKLFKVVGVSKHKDEYKVRFANDIMRIKVLAKNGHEDIRLIELEEPMSKIDAVTALSKVDEFQDVSAKMAIDEYLSENAAKEPKAKTGPAAKKPKAETKSKVPDVEDFAPVETEDEDAPF